jgi:hypothetical protein
VTLVAHDAETGQHHRSVDRHRGEIHRGQPLDIAPFTRGRDEDDEQHHGLRQRIEKREQGDSRA